jgi:predicted acylesterase/phospholipase RssA/CRP-like cAMP-binding protein
MADLRDVFRKHGESVRFEAGELVYSTRRRRSSEESPRQYPGAYFVESGFVRVADPKEVDLERLGIMFEQSDTFGEFALFHPEPRQSHEDDEVEPPVPSGRPYPSRLRALTDVSAILLREEGFKAAIESFPALELEWWKITQMVLKENLAKLIVALRRREELLRLPMFEIIAAAKKGRAVRVDERSGDHQPPSGTSFVYIVSGRVRCGEPGSLVKANEPVKAITDAWIIEVDIRLPPRPGQRSSPPPPTSGSGGGPVGGPRVVLLWSPSEPPELISALTAHVATLQQLEAGRPADWSGTLVRIGGPAARTAPEEGAERAHVDVKRGDMATLDALLAGAAGTVVYVDVTRCPSAWVERVVFKRVWKFVHVGAPLEAPPPSMPGDRVVNATILARRRASGVDEFLTGAQQAWIAHFGDSSRTERAARAAAYLPGTIRLRFEETARLSTTAAQELSVRDRGSIARIARAVAERRVGVALGGGAALGYAHIALLEELESRKVPIDAVSGVSFGSLVGAHYAVGDLAHVQSLVPGWLKVLLSMLAGLPLPPAVEWYLLARLRGRLLEDLDLPFYPVSLNLQDGEWKPQLGSVAFAVRASSSLPMMLSPALAPGIRAIDGAFINNVPESVLTEQKLHVVVASNVVSGPAPAPPPWFPLPWTMHPLERTKDFFRGMGWLMKVADERDANKAHLRFEPHKSGALDGFEMWHLWKGAKIRAQVSNEAATLAAAVRREWVGRWA